MVSFFRTYCNSCEGFISHSQCDMRCSLKGKEKIYPTKFSMRDIKHCIENNIGLLISESSISLYSRTIKNLIKKGDKNTDM